jgi:hypothetical protein
VARINPLRWIKGDPPPLEDVLKTMRERVTKFNVGKTSLRISPVPRVRPRKKPRREDHE